MVNRGCSCHTENISPSEALQAILDNLSSENSSRDNLQAVRGAGIGSPDSGFSQSGSFAERGLLNIQGLARCNTPAHTPTDYLRLW